MVTSDVAFTTVIARSVFSAISPLADRNPPSAAETAAILALCRLASRAATHASITHRASVRSSLHSR
jgi:hypothetical protein